VTRSNLADSAMFHLRGKFIVFDGGEGCGKSTQAAMLQTALQQAGVPTLLVRDPGSTHIGEQIRAILLDPQHHRMSMRCEMLLYMAARAQMVKELIDPALAAGQCVICDRFITSTLAYQLGGDALTAEEIHRVGQVAVGGRWPDLTILLDMPVDRSAARLAHAPDRIEQRPVEYHQRVRENYLAQARQHEKKVRIIDADRDRQAIHADVMRLLGQMKDDWV